MQFGHSIGRRRAYDAQVRHTHIPLAVLVDERHTLKTLYVSWILRGNLLQEATVDFIDNLQMARQQLLHHRHWPLLKRLRKNGMVGVASRAPRQIPSLVPSKSFVVDQDTHQLWDN